MLSVGRAQEMAPLPRPCWVWARRRERRSPAAMLGVGKAQFGAPRPDVVRRARQA